MLKQALFVERTDVEARHRLAERPGGLGDRAGVVEMRGRADDRRVPVRGV